MINVVTASRAWRSAQIGAYTSFKIGCVDASDTQWLRSLANVLMGADQFWQVSMDCYVKLKNVNLCAIY